MTTGGYSSVRRIGALTPVLADQASPEALVVTDPYGRIADALPGAAKLLGARAKSIVSKLLVYRLAAGSRSHLIRMLTCLRAAEPVDPFVALLRPISGAPFMARITGEPLGLSALFLFEIHPLGPLARGAAPEEG